MSSSGKIQNQKNFTSFEYNRLNHKRKMENLKLILGQWQKVMEKYNINSMKLQRKISDIIKKQWNNGTNTEINIEDMKKFIDRAENFTQRAENKLYRSMFALDTLMCEVENDLEDVGIKPTKKMKICNHYSVPIIESDVSEESESDTTGESDSESTSSESESE